jgi:hypothetical protein
MPLAGGKAIGAFEAGEKAPADSPDHSKWTLFGCPPARTALGFRHISMVPTLLRLTGTALTAGMLSGCSMSTEYFIGKSLRDAGYSRPEAQCVVEGVAGQLSRDHLWAVRALLVRYVMLDEPAKPMSADHLLEWLRPEVSPQVHHVVAHYAARCRQ